MLIINRYTHCINDFVLNSFYVYGNVESLYSVDFYVVDIREWFVTVSYVFCMFYVEFNVLDNTGLYELEMRPGSYRSLDVDT